LPSGARREKISHLTDSTSPDIDIAAYCRIFDHQGVNRTRYEREDCHHERTSVREGSVFRRR
jgi:hypothetical protein